MDSPKILMIGLDGVEPSLLERWSMDGTMPTLKTLMQQGSYRRLSTPSILAGSVGPAFNTGRSPSSTGVYYHLQWNPESMSLVRKDIEVYSQPYFWTRLGEQGKRVITIDVEEAAVQPLPNSIQIAGWQLHDAWVPMGSWPPDLMRQVISRFGHQPLGLEQPVQGRPRQQSAIFKQLLRSLKKPHRAG